MAMAPVMLRALWAYRGFVLGSVRREFQLKYRGSVLGVAWNILNPLTMILVFTLVFATVMKPSLPGQEANRFAYSIYLCSGLIGWQLLAEMLARLNTVFIDNANLMKKISFPRICLPAIVVLSALVNYAMLFGLFLCFLVLTGNFPGVIALAMFPVLAVQVMFGLGLGLLLGSLNVFFRDVGQFTGVVLQFWFWLTPVVYVATILPPGAVQWLRFNPMWPVVRAYQDIFTAHAMPDWTAIGIVAALATLLLAFSGTLFLRLSGEMVDEL